MARRDGGIIETKMYKAFNCINGNLPHCYVLPKIQKVRSLLKIIVLGSPLYNVACYLHDILHQSISKLRSHIGNGWSFANIIRNTNINNNEILVPYCYFVIHQCSKKTH